jgi:hypothetical protein
MAGLVRLVQDRSGYFKLGQFMLGLVRLVQVM